MSNATIITATVPGMHSGTVAPSCDEYFAEITDILNGFTDEAPYEVNMTSEESSHLTIERAVSEIAGPYICGFGIIGNILNLIILTRKSLQCSMDHMEKSAHMGLVALAVSDMFFCLVYLLTIFIPKKVAYFSPYDWVAGLYYHTYKEGLINLFVFSSTWLTVIMALGRYIAVCRPLHARGCINLRATRVSIAGVFAASLLINIPRFMHYQVLRIPCEEITAEAEMNITEPDGIDCPCDFYHQDTGSLYRNTTFVFYYNIAWSILAIFGPLIILTVCNVCLIRALRHSYRVQKLYRANKPKDSGHAITPTLIALIIMFIVLVGPSGILTFFRDTVLDHNVSSSVYHTYMSAIVFTNCLVSVNFAVNFVLYCIVNAQFRKIAKEMLCCLWVVHRRRPSRFGSVYSRNSHNTGTFNVSDVETEL